jgi:hypothetical protein
MHFGANGWRFGLIITQTLNLKQTDECLKYDEISKESNGPYCGDYLFWCLSACFGSIIRIRAYRGFTWEPSGAGSLWLVDFFARGMIRCIPFLSSHLTANNTTLYEFRDF